MSMKHTTAAAAIALVIGASFAPPAHARRVMDATHITPDARAAIRGKTIALTVHEPTPYSATDAKILGRGKWAFVFAPAIGSSMLSDMRNDALAAGKGVVDRTGVADPATLVRDILLDALVTTYGVVPQAPDATPSTEHKPKPLADAHPGVDYVLDVRTVRWGHSPRVYDKEHGAVGLSVEMQVVDVATRHNVAWMQCDGTTHGEPDPPLFDALEANDGALIKQAVTYLAWKCARRFANERLAIYDKLAPVPAEFASPFKPAAVSAETRGNGQ